MKYYLIVILASIPWMANDVGLFLCLFAIRISLLEKWLVRSLDHITIELFVFLLFSRVCISLGCHHKIPYNEWLKQQKFTSHNSEAGKSKIKVSMVGS